MKNALIYPNYTKENIGDAIKKVSSVFDRLGIGYHVTGESTGLLEYIDSVDFIAVLGGDGTILSVAELAADHEKPILGINIGRLGYMAEMELHETGILDGLATGEYNIENRFMIKGEIIRDNIKIRDFRALNEIFISRGIVSKMIDIILYCDGTMVSNYRADGIIVSTPTGSTAYSLSAGGPIIDPKLEVMSVCTVCPHGLNGCPPMVFSKDAVLSVSVSSGYNGDLYLTADGNRNEELKNGDIIKICGSEKYIQMITFKKNAFYRVLYDKFGNLQ